MQIETEPADLSFSGQLTEEELRKIHRATYPRIFTFWPWLYLLAIALALVTADWKALDAQPLQNAPGALLLLAIAIYLYVAPRRSARKAWQTHVGLREPFSGHLSSTGLSWQGAYGGGQYPWDALYGYRLRGDVLLLYIGLHEALSLRPRFFASAEDWVAAEELVSNNLRPR